MGAGSSGLAAARELSLAGHQVTVFERGRRLGGLWASSGLEAEGEEGAEDGDGAGGGGGAETSSSSRKAPPPRVHSSLYPSLRTNLPRILMGFASYPFTKEAMELTEAERKEGARSGSGREGEEDRGDGEEGARAPLETLDFKTYPGHGLVLRYLQSYSDEFELERFVRYGRELVRASPVFSARGDDGGGNSGGDGEREVLPWPRWRVVTRATVPAGETGDAFLPFDYSSISSSSPDESLSEEVFDALVCCSGHFAVPRLPPSALAAIETKKKKSPLAFPGLILHAHSYRGPGIGPLARVLLHHRREEEGEKPKQEAVVVAVVGAGPSGEDIAREVSGLADRVLLCSSAPTWEGVPLPRGMKTNIEPRPFVVKLDAEGVHFGEGRDEGGGGGRSDDGGGGGGGEREDNGDDASPSPPPPPPRPPPPPERVDAVIYATGYLYDFPELSGTVAVEDNEVLQAAAAGGGAGAGEGGGEGGGEEERPPLHHHPLWEHLFCPRFSVGLSLLGLPFKVVPFPLVEAQARLVARALALVPSERDGEERGNEVPAAFPSTPEKMAAAALEAARERAELGVARRHTHRMGCPSHFEYIDRLVDAAEALGGIGGGGGGGGRGKNDGGDDDEQQANGGASPSPPPPLSPSPSEENWRLAPWRQAMYMRASEARRRDADSYRDTADLGEDNVRQAEAEASAWLALRKKRTRMEGKE